MAKSKKSENNPGSIPGMGYVASSPEVGAVATDGAPAPRDIEVITAEINFYKNQAGEAILEIGRRLNEAKNQLEHGEWLTWLSERVEFSEASAQRFMRLAREYANPSPVTDLGASKALVLLALPAEIREEFIAETHTVDGEELSVAEMSKRELEKAVRERAEALELKAAADAAAEEAAQLLAEHIVRLSEFEEKYAAARKEAVNALAEKAALAEELDKLRTAPSEVIVAEPDQMMIEEIRKQIETETKTAAEETYRKKIAAADEAKKAADEKAAQAEREREELQKRYEAEREAAAERVTRLEKQLKAASSEDVATFKANFETAQGCVNAMLGCLKKLDDEPETRDKLAAALRALCEKTISQITDNG